MHCPCCRNSCFRTPARARIFIGTASNAPTLLSTAGHCTTGTVSLHGSKKKIAAERHDPSGESPVEGIGEEALDLDHPAGGEEDEPREQVHIEREPRLDVL